MFHFLLMILGCYVRATKLHHFTCSSFIINCTVFDIVCVWIKNNNSHYYKCDYFIKAVISQKTSQDNVFKLVWSFNVIIYRDSYLCHWLQFLSAFILDFCAFSARLSHSSCETLFTVSLNGRSATFWYFRYDVIIQHHNYSRNSNGLFFNI